MTSIINHKDTETSLVTFYETHEQAEQAINKLEAAGYNLKQLSIVATNLYTTENVIGYYNVYDRMKEWGGLGAFWGGFWGMLFGAATFSVPWLDIAVLPGIVASILTGIFVALVTAFLGISGAALYSLIRPKRKIVKYEQNVLAAKYMLLAKGNEQEINLAQEVLDVKVPKENSEFLNVDPISI